MVTHKHELYENVIELGPRRIGKVAGFPVIYLPKELLPKLYGKKVMVIIEMLPENLESNLNREKG